jgi:hypothetical protein
MLPEHNDYAGKNVGKRGKKRKTGALRARDGHLEPAPAAANAAPATSPQILAIVARRADMPRCDVCSKSFTSAAQLEEHRRGKAHRRATRAEKRPGGGDAETPPRGFPPKKKGGGHRSAAGGGASGGGRDGPSSGSGPPRPAPGPPPPAGAVAHCALCRKTFTSAEQLREHEGGKWHAMRLSGALAPSRKPYS